MEWFTAQLGVIVDLHRMLAWEKTAHYGKGERWKISANSSHFWAFLGTFRTGVFWRLNSHSPKKFTVNTAELVSRACEALGVGGLKKWIICQQT